MENSGALCPQPGLDGRNYRAMRRPRRGLIVFD
jgi:hypothetical protein